MKIAVTSVTGKLGSSILRNFIPEVGRENIIGIARSPERAKDLGVEVRKGDYNQREEFDRALKGVEKVLLISGMDDPQKRIQQHRNVIEAARLNNLKSIIYTSILGDEENTAFSPVVKSNRQTEEDIRNSGLNWTIGRNGIYIEPDLEYLDTYVKEGEIRNCAGNGKCGYTSREELGHAYTNMLLSDHHKAQTYNLVGDCITQNQLADLINRVYKTNLIYREVSVEDYKMERQNELGEFLGSVIAGIYEGIRKGANEVESHYEAAAGRPHKSILETIESFKRQGF